MAKFIEATDYSSAKRTTRSTDALDCTAFPDANTMDPFAAVGDQLAGLNASIRAILGVDHPVLHKVGPSAAHKDGLVAS